MLIVEIGIALFGLLLLFSWGYVQTGKRTSRVRQITCEPIPALLPSRDEREVQYAALQARALNKGYFLLKSEEEDYHLYRENLFTGPQRVLAYTTLDAITQFLEIATKAK